MKGLKNIPILLSVFLAAASLSPHPKKPQDIKIRPPVDTVGFAHMDWQVDSIMDRIMRIESSGSDRIQSWQCVASSRIIKSVICPHDDYTYVGQLYPAVLSCIEAKTIILFGVAHRARLLGIENMLVFDSYDYWKEPYGPVKVSNIREEIMQELPGELYQVNDSLQSIEHSVEALIPFLQYFNKDIEIISILVPYMPFERMNDIAGSLSEAIENVIRRHHWKWGADVAIAITSDAVHYGDEGWGGSNYAFYGTDSSGYQLAVKHEWEIINAISGEINPENVRKFMTYTVQEEDYTVYKWTWCGRYSIPMGLLTSYYLAQLEGLDSFGGVPVGYCTSIDHEHLKVDDLRMGVTAPATMRHWVGYAGIIYK
jgi:AmmeMemoRadiSam system protein B